MEDLNLELTRSALRRFWTHDDLYDGELKNAARAHAWLETSEALERDVWSAFARETADRNEAGIFEGLSRFSSSKLWNWVIETVRESDRSN